MSLMHYCEMSKQDPGMAVPEQNKFSLCATSLNSVLNFKILTWSILLTLRKHVIVLHASIVCVMQKTASGNECKISWTDLTRLPDLDFADDIAVLAEMWEKLQQPTTNLERFALKIGLRIHTPLNIDLKKIYIK